MGGLLFSRKVLRGLFGEEGREGGMGGGDDERRLEAEGRAALGVEMVDLLRGALGRVAPVRGASGAVELEVEAEVVGDRQRRALVEEGDEVGRQGRLPGVLTELGQGRGP